MTGPTTLGLAVRLQDTASGVAFVPKAGGPPDTSAYMWAGYAVAAIIYVGYAMLLRRRHAHVRRAP